MSLQPNEVTPTKTAGITARNSPARTGRGQTGRIIYAPILYVAFERSQICHYSQMR